MAKAQLALGKHVFEVKEKGASLFPYIIEDGAFRIQLSRPGHKAPMAYVKVSYMAKHGFPASELYEGTEDFLANAYQYHEQKAHDLSQPFETMITEKLALKHRQYNTAINDPDQEAKRKAKEVADQARAYRKESDG